jgi:hypothetical protein
MRIVPALCFLTVAAFIAGCDLRSDTAKREMEEFSGTPTPTMSPTPTEAPIDPLDIVTVDTGTVGTTISVSGGDKKESVTCKTFDRVMVNGNRSVVTVKGACRLVIINGDSNQITADAFMDIVINGSGNTVTYSRYVNGKRPVINNNAEGNTVEKASAAEVTGTPSKNKSAK